MAKALKKPRKKVNGYKMPDPIPLGEILTDVSKTAWKLGASIGTGGFGEIYLAQQASAKSSKYPFVIKVEPHGNGPLFVEMHFYMKNAKKADIESFIKKHKLKSLGMPAYLGSGSHEIGDTKYRFIVMDKFGTDIDKLRAETKGTLSPAMVFQLAWQITYVLEYIHDLGYVHADIKGGNVLLGATPETKNQAYLLDFGLAIKFTTNKEFKPNPKKAHDGTVEYLSRDAHHGVPTRRGDFEILGYNIIHWLGGTLPWESHLQDPKKVQTMKEDSMSDIPKFVRTCLKKQQDTVVKFLTYVNKLEFNEKPDYKKIRTLFEQEVKRNGGSVDGPLENTVTVRKRRSGGIDPAQLEQDEVGEEEGKTGARKKVRKQKDSEDVQQEEVLNDAMKEILNKKTAKKGKKKQQETEDQADASEEVMTEAMKEVLARKKEKEATTKKKATTKKINGTPNGNDYDGYTAEMIEISQKKQSRSSPDAEKGQKAGGRTRRNIPLKNYDEQTPKLSKKK